MGGLPTGRPLFGLKVIGEERACTGGRGRGIFFGRGAQEDEELVDGGWMKEFVDWDIVEAWRWLLSALAREARGSSVETVSLSWEEDIVDAWRSEMSTWGEERRFSSVETLLG